MQKVHGAGQSLPETQRPVRDGLVLPHLIIIIIIIIFIIIIIIRSCLTSSVSHCPNMAARWSHASSPLT